MEVEITVGKFIFTTWAKRALNIRGVNQLNGFYLYDEEKAVINVASNDFKKMKTDNTFIQLFKKVVTHEALHHAIDGCVEKRNTPEEEDLVLRLAGQAGPKNI